MKTTSFFCLVLLFLFIRIESVSAANTIDRDSIKIPLEVNFCKLYDLRNSDSGRPKDKRASIYHYSNQKRKRKLAKGCGNSFVPLWVANNDSLEFKYSWRNNPNKIKLDNVGDLKKLRVSEQVTKDKIEFLHGVVYLIDKPAEGILVSNGSSSVVTDVMGRYAFKYTSGDIKLKFMYKLKQNSVGEMAERTATLTVNTGDDKHARVDVFFDDDKKDIVPAK